MKKKLILILSMVALLSCVFVVSVSASNYGFDFDNLQNSFGGVYNVYLNKDHNDNCNISSPSNFGVGYIDGYYFYINIEFWHQLFSDYGVSDFESFCMCLESLFANGVLCNRYETGCRSELGFLVFNYCESFYDIYVNYLNEPETKTYEDGFAEGKELGVSEYVSSEEYTNALNNKYTEGKQAGYDEGVTAGTDIGYNTGYAQGQTDGYSDGYTIGYNEYIGSKEYAKVLKAKYDDGFSDGEEEAKASSFNVIISVLPVMLILDAVAIGIVVYKVIKRSKNEIQK